MLLLEGMGLFASLLRSGKGRAKDNPEISANPSGQLHTGSRRACVVFSQGSLAGHQATFRPLAVVSDWPEQMTAIEAAIGCAEWPILAQNCRPSHNPFDFKCAP